MVSRLFSNLLFSLVLTCLFISTTLVAQDQHQFIRFYKINKNEQPTRLFIRRSTAEKSGCHNFKLKARVHRLNQIGYKTCSIYAKKNCHTDSTINATRKKDQTAKEQFTEGYSWFPVSKHPHGVKVKSWSCESAL